MQRKSLQTAKKMQALVSSSHSLYKDRTFPSGMNWDDYIHWCLGAMYCLEEEGVGGNLSSGVVTLQHQRDVFVNYVNKRLRFYRN